MSYLLTVPVIDPGFSRPCIDGLDPSIWPHTFIVDNSHRGLGWRTHRRQSSEFQSIEIHRAGRNLGVARAWNVAIREARSRGVDKIIFVSAQVRFGPAAGLDLVAVAEQTVHVECPTPPMWHVACFDLGVFDVVGLFDENFYPAYFEDADMTRRLRLAGIVERYGNDPQGWGHHVDAVAPRDGHGVDRLAADHPGKQTFRIERLAAYWAEKWAIHDHQCTDTANGNLTPFGDPANGLGYWPARTIDELCALYDIVGG